jgi:hypothetical protein
MFKVTGMKAGILWDAENDKPMVKFVDGVAETDNEAIAIKLRDMGYAVEGDFTPDNSYQKMKVDELKAYASEKGINLGEASNKKEIIAKIQEAEANA